MLDTSLLGKFNPPNQNNLTDNLTEICQGLLPAFRDLASDETHISTTEEGKFSVSHELANLPFEWVDEWDEDGYPLSLRPTIIAGYVRGSDFYSLLDLTHIKLDS